MDLTRIILKEFIKNHDEENLELKVNVEEAMEYAKWLSYIPDFQRQSIETILKKKIDELTDLELKQLEQFKEQQNLAPIFFRYITKECKKEDLLPVYDYMKKTSLDKIMISKLTEEELIQANKIIGEVSQCNHFELHSLVSNWKEPNAYRALTMVHAYCFHILKKNSIRRASNQLDEEIKRATNSNNAYTIDIFGNKQRLIK